MRLNYFNFKSFGDYILMTNDFGKYLFVTPDEFKQIVAKTVNPDTELYGRLLSAKMIYDETDLEFSSVNRYELRESKNYLNQATGLHIFVVATGCNLRCIYCQANNGKTNSNYKMDYETAEKAVDVALQSPEKYLDFEFQGGEPLLNYPVIKHIIEYTEQNKDQHEIQYNLVSNLILLTDDMVDFFTRYHVSISTSIDGPEVIHNHNRKFPDGTGSFQSVRKNIKKLQGLGINVGAIETTTKYSLGSPEEIVHAYLDFGLDSIFIRPLTPLGRAANDWDKIGYTAEEYLDFYRRAFDELININKAGIFIRENLASIFLNKMLGQSINYMELRSPCGAGVGQMAYYPDGNVFTCDEGRMVYEMGDDAFCLGNVYKNKYRELIETSECKTVCISSILETIPACCDCVYQPYCGTCPVVNYAQDKDVIEKAPHSYRCKIYSGILDYIFSKLHEDDEETINILHSWIH